jgi:hypothetical protein
VAADGEGQSKPPRHATSDLTLFQQASEIFLEKMEGTFFGGMPGFSNREKSRCVVEYATWRYTSASAILNCNE